MSNLFLLFFTLCSSFISTSKTEDYSFININELEEKSIIENTLITNVCYKKEIDLQEQEWPFRSCYNDYLCAPNWNCENCICEPKNPKNYIYIYKGFFASSDPSFYEDPSRYFSYENRINTILLELGSDPTKAMIVPVKNETEVEGYQIGDVIKIMPSDSGIYSPIIRSTVDIYNDTNKRLKIIRSLYICDGDSANIFNSDCGSINYEITHGHEDRHWLDRKRVFNYF